MAVGFSPTSLIFNLNPGGEDCQMITINSESETISVSDKWAENKDIEWKVSLFNESADYHNIDISYDELLENESQVEVCLSGENIGEYHGVALLTEEQSGNSIVQVGVWLKAIVEAAPTQITSGGSSSSSGSSSGGSVGGGITTTASPNKESTNTNNLNTNNEINNPELQKGEEEQAENSGITGAVIGGKASMIGAVVLIIVVIAIGLIIYKRNRWKKYGY